MEDFIKFLTELKVLANSDKKVCEKDLVEGVINSAVNVANYVSKSINKDNRYTNKCSILIDMTMLNYHSLMENKDILFKNVDIANINKYYGAIRFIIDIRNKYDFISEHDTFIAEYNKYHIKPIEEMSKGELLEYIKKHNIK